MDSARLEHERSIAKVTSEESALSSKESDLTPHQILAVCLRTGALIWGAYSLIHIPEQFIRLDHPVVDNRAAVWVIAGCQLGGCAVLWFLPGTIAKMLLPGKDVPEFATPCLVDWQMLGVVLVGLFALAQAIPAAVYWVILLHSWPTGDFGAGALTVAQKARLASVALELVITVGMVFGARGITRYLFGVREVKSGDRSEFGGCGVGRRLSARSETTPMNVSGLTQWFVAVH